MTEPMVFDLLENEDVSLIEILTSGDRTVFKLKDSYNSTDTAHLMSTLKDRSHTFYECKSELSGAPFEKDVVMETPYFRLQLNGNFTVPEASLSSALASRSSVFALVETDKKIAFLSAFGSVQRTPGIDGLGREVNIVSADHCQKGTQQNVYDLKVVKMIHAKSSAGRRRRKTFRKGKKKAKKQTRKRRV